MRNLIRRTPSPGVLLVVVFCIGMLAPFPMGKAFAEEGSNGEEILVDDLAVVGRNDKDYCAKVGALADCPGGEGGGGDLQTCKGKKTCSKAVLKSRYKFCYCE